MFYHCMEAHALLLFGIYFLYLVYQNTNMKIVELFSESNMICNILIITLFYR